MTGCLSLWYSSTYLVDISLSLTSNNSVNRRSGFLALGFLEVTKGPCDIGLLSVNISGVENISASIIDLYCYWSSYLPGDLYNLLIFSIQICSYIALLLNDWYIPIVAICCFSRSDCNNPLRMTHCCSNYSISRVKSINLVNDFYLAQWYAWDDLPSIWKQIYYFPFGGSFNDVINAEELIWHRQE